jgi:hypothetical protein
MLGDLKDRSNFKKGLQDILTEATERETHPEEFHPRVWSRTVFNFVRTLDGIFENYISLVTKNDPFANW